MKRLYKILLVFALTAISYGASAQQQVKLNSVRNYSVTNVAPNLYSWYVDKSEDGGINWSAAAEGVDFNFVTDATGGTVKNIADVSEQLGGVSVFIKWKKTCPVNTLYRVAITEYNHTADVDRCDNTKYLEVEVLANNVTVEISSTEGGCTALDAAKIIQFAVKLDNGGEKSGGDKTWTFTYDLYYNGTLKVSDEVVTANTFTTSGTEMTYTLEVFDIEKDDDGTDGDAFTARKGQGTYTVKVVLKSAEDVFNTPAAISIAEKEITFNQVPKIEGGIVTD